MNTKDVAYQMLDNARGVEEKAGILRSHLQQEAIFGRNMRLGRRFGVDFGVKLLYEAVEPDKRALLRETIDSVVRHLHSVKAKRDAEVTIRARELRKLPAGSTVIIRRADAEEAVIFLEAKRTRFTFEYPDGRRFNDSIASILRIEPVEGVRRLSESNRGMRDLVRQLGGRAFADAEKAILALGVAVVHVCLDEFAAAKSRIEDAPIGFSGGYFSHALGPTKIVDSWDRALVERMPCLLVKLANSIGVDEVHQGIGLLEKREVRDELKIAFDQQYAKCDRPRSAEAHKRR